MPDPAAAPAGPGAVSSSAASPTARPALEPSRETIAIAERVRAAIDARTPLRIVGGGTWINAGGASPATEMLPIGRHSGIVEYVPGDLTLTARAGTTLAEIGAAAAEADQWLPLDPAGTDAGTIGATIATASAGSLASGFGLPRDMVLGVEAVTGTGAIVRGGGRVVKNVAGFDLTRLFTGSWGTLAAITEVSIRLRARPVRDESVVVKIDDTPESAERVWRVLREWPFAPIAAELLNASLARSIGAADGMAALIRVAGNETAVDAQLAALRSMGDVVPADTALWRRLRAADGNESVVVRLSSLPSRAAAVWRSCAEGAKRNPGMLFHASLSRGVVRCIIPPPGSSSGPMDDSWIRESGTTVVWERWGRGASPRDASRSTESLERALLATFNPHGVLNPGVFGPIR